MIIVEKCGWCARRRALVFDVKVKGHRKANICAECYKVVMPFVIKDKVDSGNYEKDIGALSIEAAEKKAIAKVMIGASTKTQAAGLLGITRDTLYQKLKKYGIKI